MKVCDDRGATAAEYALMIGLIALVIIGAVELLGISVVSLFSNPELVDALS